jgi:hypothetical protein
MKGELVNRISSMLKPKQQKGVTPQMAPSPDAAVNQQDAEAVAAEAKRRRLNQRGTATAPRASLLDRLQRHKPVAEE